jgi:hypothetical protein
LQILFGVEVNIEMPFSDLATLSPRFPAHLPESPAERFHVMSGAVLAKEGRKEGRRAAKQQTVERRRDAKCKLRHRVAT